MLLHDETADFMTLLPTTTKTPPLPCFSHKVDELASGDLSVQHL